MLASLPAPGPAEARRAAHPARRPRRGEPDAGAVRQAGGRQHQNEALDGGDLCAFNRQREAVVQVEVNSFFPSFLPLSPFSSKGEMVWLGAGNGSQGCIWLLADIVLLLPYHTNQLHVSSIFLLLFFFGKLRSSKLDKQTVSY